jgi:hypothetical protein
MNMCQWAAAPAEGNDELRMAFAGFGVRLVIQYRLAGILRRVKLKVQDCAPWVSHVPKFEAGSLDVLICSDRTGGCG